MAGISDVLKIITVPALIAAFLYILLAYIVVPLLRRHRERYSQYVPINTILDTTSAARSRVVSSLIDLLLRLFQRRRQTVYTADTDSQDGDEVAFGEEEGETMVGFDVTRRERSIRDGHVEIPSDARLSRDLEEGFRDDSEEDVVDTRAGRPQIRSND